MNKILKALTFSLMMVGGVATAGNRNTSISGTDQDLPGALDLQDLAQRLEVTGEVFFFDPQGRLLAKSGEMRKWQGNGPKLELESIWSFKSNRMASPLVLRHRWSLDEKGRLVAHVEQFEKVQKTQNVPHAKVEGLIKEEKFVVSDFSPIVWRVASEKQTIVVRLSPNLLEETPEKPLKGLPFSAQDLSITDSKGNLWAEYLDLQGDFVGIRTHKGALYLSFQPFEGAQTPVGSAQGSEVVLNFPDKTRLRLRAAQAIVPSGIRAQVYARVDRSKKSDRIGSSGTSTAGTYAEVLKKL